MREFFEYCKFAISVVIFSVFILSSLFASVIYVGHRIDLGGDLVKIEQLRQDSKNVNLFGSEGILKAVSEINQKIRSRQYYNSRWWSSWIIPDVWDTVELIQVK